eukprot:SM000004S15058  [mRNA]  locus=s4:1001807:1003317:+ [translate_table: standard]
MPENVEGEPDIAHRLDFIAMMMLKLQCNVFMLSYRGYGASDGFPSQHGIILDAQASSLSVPNLLELRNVAQASLDHLLARPDIDSKQIVLFGRSLGGAVATQLTANNPGKNRRSIEILSGGPDCLVYPTERAQVAAIALENTFTSVLDMAGQMLPFLGYLVGTEGVKPLNPLVRSPWRTVDIIASILAVLELAPAFRSLHRHLYSTDETHADSTNPDVRPPNAPQVHTPVLFLAGLQDEMVPPVQMRRLFEQCKTDPRNAAVFVEFRTGAHMDTWVKGGERYWRVLELFLRQHVMERKQPHGAAASGARAELSDELLGQRHAVL